MEQLERKEQEAAVLSSSLLWMRASVERDPQILLETWGGPCGLAGDYVFADIFGHDDELLDSFLPLPSVMAVYHKPMMARQTLMLADMWTDAYTIRTADYGLRSAWSRCAVAASYLPGWRHDDSFLVHLLYVRYKRRL